MLGNQSQILLEVDLVSQLRLFPFAQMRLPLVGLHAPVSMDRWIGHFFHGDAHVPTLLNEHDPSRAPATREDASMP